MYNYEVHLLFVTKCGKPEMVVSDVHHVSCAPIAFTTSRIVRYKNTLSKESV